jgi:heptosyltransferase-3
MTTPSMPDEVASNLPVPEVARRVLVLRPGAIGDTLVTLPALLALRRRFPEASIEAIGNATALPVAQASGLIDRWLPFDDGRVTRLFMPAEPPPDDHFLGTDVAVAWGRDADGTLARALASRGASPVIVAPSRPDPNQPEHVARHLLRSLAPLGIQARPDNIELPELRVPGEADTRALAELAAAGLGGRPYVAIHPGSGSVAKNWPAEQYAEVVDRLQREHGLASVILGGPADADTLVMVHDRTDQPPSAVVERPLLVVAALLRRAAAFLGNDSGLAHLAGLLGVPTLALFGPSDPTLWAPLGPRVRVLRSASLAALPTDTVLSALTSLLGG